MNLKLIILACFIPVLAFAQKNDVQVFRTYDDFLNKKSEDYVFKKTYPSGPASTGIVLEDGKEKVKVNGKNAWGYTYKDALFRFDSYNMPVRVLSVGKIVYYGNGQAHMDMVKNNKDSGYWQYGYMCYVSRDLGSDIAPIDVAPKMDPAKGKLDAFKKANPQYKSFFECVKRGDGPKEVMECVKKLEDEESN